MTKAQAEKLQDLIHASGVKTTFIAKQLIENKWQWVVAVAGDDVTKTYVSREQWTQRQLESERDEWKQRAEAAGAKLSFADEYAAAKCDAPYNDSLTFEGWLQSRV